MSTSVAANTIKARNHRKKRQVLLAATFGLDVNAKEIYGRNLNYWLRLRGWSNARLAREIGHVGSAVTHWTRFRSAPDMETIGRIAVLLDVPLSEFFKDPPYDTQSALPKLALTATDDDGEQKTVRDLDLDDVMRQLASHLGGEFRKKRKKPSR